MNDIKELAKWLEEEVEFLKTNQDYVGGWYDLGNGLAAVVLWEEGWGDEVRDDAIQAAKNPDWALCTGVMLINRDDTPDGWFMPWDSKTGDLICETTGITPIEDYDNLAKWLLQDFNLVKDCEIKPNGEVMDFDAQFEDEDASRDEKANANNGEKPWDDSKHFDDEEDDGLDTKIISINGKPVEEESKEVVKKKIIKESKEYSTSPYHDVIAEYFDYDSDFEFLDVVASVVGRIDDFTSDEDIYQAIDDELIYTYDQWTVLEHYCTPQDANWSVAMESFTSDIFGLCATIAEANNMKEEEPEEENNDNE